MIIYQQVTSSDLFPKTAVDIFKTGSYTYNVCTYYIVSCSFTLFVYSFLFLCVFSQSAVVDVFRLAAT